MHSPLDVSARVTVTKRRAVSALRSYAPTSPPSLPLLFSPPLSPDANVTPSPLLPAPPRGAFNQLRSAFHPPSHCCPLLAVESPGGGDGGALVGEKRGSWWGYAAAWWGERTNGGESGRGGGRGCSQTPPRSFNHLLPPRRYFLQRLGVPSPWISARIRSF